MNRYSKRKHSTASHVGQSVLKPLLSFIMFWLLLSVQPLSAAQPPERLFEFYRSKNANYICYDVHHTNNQLDKDAPVMVYWICAAEDGSRKDLTFFQKKMAFGYTVEQFTDNEAVILLRAYNKLPIRICRRNNRWMAVALLHGREARLTKMYVQTKSPDSLKVLYVDVFGIDLQTGKPVKQRILNK